MPTRCEVYDTAHVRAPARHQGGQAVSGIFLTARANRIGYEPWSRMTPRRAADRSSAVCSTSSSATSRWSPRPFAVLAERLGRRRGGRARAPARLHGERCGLAGSAPWSTPHTAPAASTLAAMTVPDDELEAVAAMVSACPEVNHNYEREHRLNLWFVVAAPSRERVGGCWREIENRTSLAGARPAAGGGLPARSRVPAVDDPETHADRRAGSPRHRPMACRWSSAPTPRPGPRCWAWPEERGDRDGCDGCRGRRDQALRRDRPPSRTWLSAPTRWWCGTCPMPRARGRRRLPPCPSSPLLPPPAPPAGLALQSVLHDPRARARHRRSLVGRGHAPPPGWRACRARCCSAVAASSSAAPATCRRPPGGRLMDDTRPAAHQRAAGRLSGLRAPVRRGRRGARPRPRTR